MYSNSEVDKIAELAITRERNKIIDFIRYRFDHMPPSLAFDYPGDELLKLINKIKKGEHWE